MHAEHLRDWATGIVSIEASNDLMDIAFLFCNIAHQLQSMCYSGLCRIPHATKFHSHILLAAPNRQITRAIFNLAAFQFIECVSARAMSKRFDGRLLAENTGDWRRWSGTQTKASTTENMKNVHGIQSNESIQNIQNKQIYQFRSSKALCRWYSRCDRANSSLEHVS